MTNVERAKQFLPFDAMKGLKEAMQKREEKMCRMEKMELSEDKQEELSDALVKLSPGQTVEITFYFGGHYLTIEGTVVKKDVTYKYLTIGNQKIFFDSIYSLKISNEIC